MTSARTWVPERDENGAIVGGVEVPADQAEEVREQLRAPRIVLPETPSVSADRPAEAPPVRPEASARPSGPSGDLPERPADVRSLFPHRPEASAGPSGAPDVRPGMSPEALRAGAAVSVVMLLAIVAALALRPGAPAEAPPVPAAPTAAPVATPAPTAAPTAAPAVSVLSSAVVAYHDYRRPETATPLEAGRVYTATAQAAGGWVLVDVGAPRPVWVRAAEAGIDLRADLPDVTPAPPAPVAASGPAISAPDLPPPPSACPLVIVARPAVSASGDPIGWVEGRGCSEAEALAAAEQLEADMRAARTEARTEAPAEVAVPRAGREGD